jgi:hypothetical protein
LSCNPIILFLHVTLEQVSPHAADHAATAAVAAPLAAAPAR